MFKTLFKTLLRPAYARYRDLVTRVEALETAVRCMVRNPVYVAADDAGFNGQLGRKAIFMEIIQRCHNDLILETGTFIGNTTGYMAQTSGLPVHTCESNISLFTVGGQRLAAIPGIQRHHGDSRAFLRELTARRTGAAQPFVYLDAHWSDDLPLAEELEILCRNWPGFVAMVDDFEVPGDPGYGFDDYGRRRRLALADFGPVFRRLDLAVFFPTLPSARETGARRGCVVLVPAGPLVDSVAGSGLLAPPPG